MSDQPILEEQAPAAPPQQKPDMIEKARFDGLVRKVEELTLSNRELSAQLTGKSSEIEQLSVQLGVKDYEKGAAVNERDKQLQSIVEAKTAMEKELDDLRALKLKLEVAKELGRPDLIKILDRIPSMTDKEALKSVLSDFSNYADEAVREREKQLLSGMTPGLSSQQTTSAPSSDKSWEDHINGLPMGSKERQKAFDDYGKWLAETHKQ